MFEPGSATEGWSSASACTIAAGASARATLPPSPGGPAAKDRRAASAARLRRRAIVFGKSEISQARARDRVASARSPAGAVRIQLMNCRTIMVLPAYAT